MPSHKNEPVIAFAFVAPWVITLAAKIGLALKPEDVIALIAALQVVGTWLARRRVTPVA